MLTPELAVDFLGTPMRSPAALASDRLDPFGRQTLRRVAWSSRKVVQASTAFGPKAGQPLVSGLAADTKHQTQFPQRFLASQCGLYQSLTRSE
jgi:hypothetical protein